LGAAGDIADYQGDRLVSVYCFPEKEAAAAALAEKIVKTSTAALERRRCFSLVLAGGSTPGALYELLATEPWRKRIDWCRAHVFFGDERCVPFDHRYSNYAMAYGSLLSAVPVPPNQVHRIHGEGDPAREAETYGHLIETTLSSISPEQPLFDLVLLGLGADGHTASLYPGDTALQSSGLVTAVDPPKTASPPVPRISLTLEGIKLARTLCFLVHGSSKKDIVQAVRADTEGRYPAALAVAETVSWYLSGMECDEL